MGYQIEKALEMDNIQCKLHACTNYNINTCVHGNQLLQHIFCPAFP